MHFAKPMKRAHTTEKINTDQTLKQGRKRAGTTIVETLVALTVFATFIAGASKMLLSHRAIADMTREHYTAVNIAKNRVELARTFNFADLEGFGETDVVVDALGDPVASSVGNYRRSTAINLVTNNLVQLTVSIDIRNHKTWAFDGASQEVESFISFHR